MIDTSFSRDLFHRIPVIGIMRNPKRGALFLIFLLALNYSSVAGGPAVVSKLSAEFRNGQVFLLWNEADTNRHNLRIYISGAPITERNLKEARLLTDQLEPHSGNDWYDDPNECPRTTGTAHGWIIDAGRQPLHRGGGLFVHTVLPGDPKRAYFAVLSETENEALLLAGTNSLSEPVAVKVAAIQAIWQLAGKPLPVQKGLPLALYLHAHQGRPREELTYLLFGDSSMGWREGLPFKFKVTTRDGLVLAEPYDRVWINRKMTEEEAKANNGLYDTQFRNIESWWYGTNTRINLPGQSAKGTPTNYTERWVLWALQWVQRQYGTDAARVYAFGASMGTGVLRLVLRNPQRFASVDLQVPIFDPFGEGAIGNRMKSRLGEPQSICSDGMALSKRLNTLEAIDNATTDLPPIIIRVGRKDRSVFWNSKPAFMKLVQDKEQALVAGWDSGAHVTAMRKTYKGFPDWYDFNWYIGHFAIDKSYPAFTKYSLDNDPGNGDIDSGDISGFINRGLDWRVELDTIDAYRIRVTANAGVPAYPVYVNITPRRLQQFKTAGRKRVYACNIDARGRVVDKKELTLSGGNITYERFSITSEKGNTLVFSTKRRR